MKKTNSENTLTLILIFILLIIIGIIIFAVYRSSNSLKNNNVDNTSNTNPTKNTNLPNNSTKINELPKETIIIETELATFTTTIYDKNENRIHNIKLATEKLNNKVIKSNETFSFNQTIRVNGRKRWI